MEHHWVTSLRSLALGIGLTATIRPLFCPEAHIGIRVSAASWVCASVLVFLWDAYFRDTLVVSYLIHVLIIVYRIGLLCVLGERAFPLQRRSHPPTSESSPRTQTALPPLLVLSFVSFRACLGNPTLLSCLTLRPRRILFARFTSIMVYGATHISWMMGSNISRQQRCLNLFLDTACDAGPITFVLGMATETAFVLMVIVLNVVFVFKLIGILVHQKGSGILKYHRNVEHICLQVMAITVLVLDIVHIGLRSTLPHSSAWHAVWVLRDALLLVLLTDMGCAFANVLRSSTPDNTEADLEMARFRLGQAETTKANILRFLDHELRNNMQRMTYLSDRLRLASTDWTDRIETLESIRTCSAYVSIVVEDVLSIDEFESGNVQLRNRVYDLVELVEKEFGYLQRFAEHDGVSVVADVSKLPQTYRVFGDPDRVRQVIRILGESLIRRASQSLPSSGPNRTLHSTVSVNGSLKAVFVSGLDNAFDVHMNDAYVLLPSEHHVDLSQSLAHRVLRVLHGHISMDATRKMAEVIIPLHVDLSTEVVTNTVAKKLQMLVVDDNKINRLVMRKLLKQILRDATIDEAEDGQKAIDMVLKERKVYDIIWMDVVMPRKSGFEACFEIKAVIPTAIVVMVSANAVQEEPEMLNMNSADDAIQKPISKALLKAILAKYHML